MLFSCLMDVMQSAHTESVYISFSTRSNRAKLCNFRQVATKMNQLGKVVKLFYVAVKLPDAYFPRVRHILQFCPATVLQTVNMKRRFENTRRDSDPITFT